MHVLLLSAFLKLRQLLFHAPGGSAVGTGTYVQTPPEEVQLFRNPIKKDLEGPRRRPLPLLPDGLGLSPQWLPVPAHSAPGLPRRARRRGGSDSAGRDRPRQDAKTRTPGGRVEPRAHQAPTPDCAQHAGTAVHDSREARRDSKRLTGIHGTAARCTLGLVVPRRTTGLST